jgi:hypothetical protein
VCSGCDAAPVDACASADATRPVCLTDWGQCVACTDDDAAACTGATPFCDDAYACGGCTRHAQCGGEQACDLETGTCLDAAVFWVDNGVCPDIGFGTADDPHCDITTALSNLPELGTMTVRVVGGGPPYGRIALNTPGPGTVALIGVGRPVFDGDTASLAVANGKRVYVEGIDFETGATATVNCTAGARLHLHDVRIRGGTVGLHGDDCRLEVDRAVITAAETDGVSIEGGTDLRLRNSIVAGNGSGTEDSRGLRSASSTFDVVYSTIAANVSDPVFGGGPAPNNLVCSGGTGGPVRNSIVVGPGLSTMDCPWASVETSVVDTTRYAAEGVVVVDNYDETWFFDPVALDFHLRDESGPFGDVASWQLGDPHVDLDGAARVAIPDAPGFAGADEP